MSIEQQQPVAVDGQFDASPITHRRFQEYTFNQENRDQFSQDTDQPNVVNNDTIDFSVMDNPYSRNISTAQSEQAALLTEREGDLDDSDAGRLARRYGLQPLQIESDRADTGTNSEIPTTLKCGVSTLDLGSAEDLYGRDSFVRPEYRSREQSSEGTENGDAGASDFIKPGMENLVHEAGCCCGACLGGDESFADTQPAESESASDFIKPGMETQAHEAGCCCEACIGGGANEDSFEQEFEQTDRFGSLDLNGSGKVSQAELSVAHMQNLLRLDTDDSSAIEFDELNDALKGRSPAEKFLARLGFMLSDRNRDGRLDTGEMQKIADGLARMGIMIADRNRDGALDRNELSPYLGDGQRPRPPQEAPRPPQEVPRPPQEVPPPPQDVPEPPQDRPDPPTDEPIEGVDGVPKATPEQVEQVMRQVENRGASGRYMEELRESMAELPADVVQAAIDGRTRILAVGQGRPGLGGSYNSGTNTVTMYESSPFSTKATLAAEMFHNWDLNPYIGEHVSSQGWFRDAYQRARQSGIRTGDNTMNNPYEFIHNMARYYSGYTSGVDAQLMNYLGPDYQRRTREALMS